IDQDLRQRRAGLIRRQPVIERAADMGGEFFHFAECGDHAEIENGTFARRQGFVAPGLAPAIFGQQPLEVAVEIVDVLQRTIDVSLAQHLAALGKADVIAFLVHGGFLLAFSGLALSWPGLFRPSTPYEPKTWMPATSAGVTAGLAHSVAPPFHRLTVPMS